MELKPRVKMKEKDPAERKHDFAPYLAGYTAEEASAEASRCFKCKNPRCSGACPIHNDIPSVMKAVEEKDYAVAYEILCRNTVLPAVCGTVCPHEDQCEGACINGIRGDAVAIGSIERFVAEWAEQNGLTKAERRVPNGKKAVCVGAGPASIACAEVLAKYGWDVTILEKESYFGGVLAWGIPSYRLRREAIKDKKRLLESLGVKIVYNTKVTDLQELRKQYDTVFLGTGATISNKMRVPGEDLEGVFHAPDYLSAVNLSPLDENYRRHFDKSGKNVLVVGGGNVAMDAARDAVRLPQTEKVRIVYRRSEEEMPACRAELNDAQAEGIEFLTLRNPVEFIGENGHVKQAVCAVMKLGEPDASGRRRPLETEERIVIDTDTVVLALGFSNDPEIAKANEGLDADKWGCFTVDENYKTSYDNVYAGGDAQSGASTVVKAMKAGITAARHMEQRRKNNEF